MILKRETIDTFFKKKDSVASDLPEAKDPGSDCETGLKNFELYECILYIS